MQERAQRQNVVHKDAKQRPPAGTPRNHGLSLYEMEVRVGRIEGQVHSKSVDIVLLLMMKAGCFEVVRGSLQMLSTRRFNI